MIPVAVLGFWLAQRGHARGFRQIRVLELELKKDLVSITREMTTSRDHVRSFGWSKYFVWNMLDRFDVTQKSTYHIMTILRWNNFVLEMMGAILASIFFVMILHSSRYSLSTLACAIHCFDWFAILGRQMLERYTTMELAMEPVKRLREFEAAAALSVEQHKKRLQSGATFRSTRGQVQFTNVSVASNARPDQPFALERVSTSIDAGQKVVVTGRPGR